MKKKKMSNCIKFLLFLFPLILICLNVFRDGQLSLSAVENNFSVFRSLDFGLFGFVDTMFSGGLSNSPTFSLMVDLLIYYLYFKLFDLIYSCFGVFIDLIRMFFEKFGGEK